MKGWLTTLVGDEVEMSWFGHGEFGHSGLQCRDDSDWEFWGLVRDRWRKVILGRALVVECGMDTKRQRAALSSSGMASVGWLFGGCWIMSENGLTSGCFR